MSLRYQPSEAIDINYVYDQQDQTLSTLINQSSGDIKIYADQRDNAISGALESQINNITPGGSGSLTAILGEPTGFDRKNPDSLGDLSFDNGNRTVTVSPKSGEANFYYYIAGIKYTHISGQSVIIPDTEGIHYIYFDNEM